MAGWADEGLAAGWVGAVLAGDADLVAGWEGGGLAETGLGEGGDAVGWGLGADSEGVDLGVGLVGEGLGAGWVDEGLGADWEGAGLVAGWGDGGLAGMGHEQQRGVRRSCVVVPEIRRRYTGDRQWCRGQGSKPACEAWVQTESFRQA